MKHYLVVMDMQNDFIYGNAKSYGGEKIVKKVAEKIKNWDGPIYVTMDTHDKEYFDRHKEKEKIYCIKETRGWQLVPEIQEALKGKDYEVLLKETYGCKAAVNGMLKYYRQNDVQLDIELCGVDTDVCVLTTAILFRTYLSEARVTIDSECCSGTTPEKHQAALEVMKNCDINVV